MRFNTAFAYLDPVRGKPTLTIVGNAMADRLTVRGGRITGAEVIVDGRRITVEAGRTVVAGGAYGSPGCWSARASAIRPSSSRSASRSCTTCAASARTSTTTPP